MGWSGKQRHELNRSRECEACREAEETTYYGTVCTHLCDFGLGTRPCRGFETRHPPPSTPLPSSSPVSAVVTITRHPSPITGRRHHLVTVTTSAHHRRQLTRLDLHHATRIMDLQDPQRRPWHPGASQDIPDPRPHDYTHAWQVGLEHGTGRRPALEKLTNAASVPHQRLSSAP